MFTTKESEAIAAANPSQGELRATQAFQGPGVDVHTTTAPRHYKFDPDEIPPPGKPNQPYIPRKYLGVTYDSGSGKTPAQWSEVYGVDTVKILSRTSGSDGGIVGLNGRILMPGDTVEMPVNHCMQLVQQGAAVFVLDSETAKDEKLIAELEAKGYAFAHASVPPARERPEFQSVIARKKSRWVSDSLDPALKSPS
jgi:hypothetical protein